MTPLHLLSFRPDFGRLTRLAARERLLPPGDDLGYALHAVFAASFGEHAPKPFVLLAPGFGGGGPAGRLLAYSPAPLNTLRTHAEAFADPAFSAVLDLPSAECKTMPRQFEAGTRLGFRVRIRPVTRTGKPRDGAADGDARARERDVFLAQLGDNAAEGPSRAACYIDWLSTRLMEMGARLERGQVDAFRFSRLATRDRAAGPARRQAPNGPDAIVSGTLSVTESGDFGTGLARGVGRFRAFGFGMLLLGPPRS